MKQLIYVFLGMRPHQWTKNLIIFAGVIFSQNLSDSAMVLKAVEAFLVFCAMSGVIYLVNDLADIDKDKLHEEKRKRPLPSGRLKVPVAVGASLIVGVIALVLSFYIGRNFFIVSVVFFALNFFYSFIFKRIVLLDVVSISLSFIIRAIAGVEALADLDPTIELSPWLLICTLFLSLFLAFCKRRHELVTMERAAEHREALSGYTSSLVDQLVGISAAGAILSYSIYTIWPDTVENFGTTDLVYTIPLVLLGVMRYLYLVYSEDKGGSPSEILLSERFILTVVFLWALLVVAIFYVF